jgi:hypothetical protein
VKSYTVKSPWSAAIAWSGSPASWRPSTTLQSQ